MIVKSTRQFERSMAAKFRGDARMLADAVENVDADVQSDAPTNEGEAKKKSKTFHPLRDSEIGSELRAMRKILAVLGEFDSDTSLRILEHCLQMHKQFKACKV